MIKHNFDQLKFDQVIVFHKIMVRFTFFVVCPFSSLQPNTIKNEKMLEERLGSNLKQPQGIYFLQRGMERDMGEVGLG